MAAFLTQATKASMMERDYAQYPDHENGNVWWKIKQAGEQLNILREVDFAVIFPSEEAAMDFAVRLLRFGQKVSVGRYEGVADLP